MSASSGQRRGGTDPSIINIYSLAKPMFSVQTLIFKTKKTGIITKHFDWYLIMFHFHYEAPEFANPLFQIFCSVIKHAGLKKNPSSRKRKLAPAGVGGDCTLKSCGVKSTSLKTRAFGVVKYQTVSHRRDL